MGNDNQATFEAVLGTTTVTPEPGTLMLFGSGLLGCLSVAPQAIRLELHRTFLRSDMTGTGATALLPILFCGKNSACLCQFIGTLRKAVDQLRISY